MSYNLEERAKTKKAAATAYANGDMWLASELTNKQKILKLLNNALSGAFASAGTVHFNPSAHYSLTSMTRTTSGLGNLFSESIAGGNRYYANLDTIMGHLLTTVNYSEYDKITATMKKLDLHYPTVNETMEAILYSASLYGIGAKDLEIVYNYVYNLEPAERAAIVYTNDFYHLERFNRKFIRSLLIKTSKMESGLIEDLDEQIEIIFDSMGEYLSLGLHICMDHAKGIEIKPKIRGTKLADYLSSTILNIVEQFKYYGDLYRTFFGGRIHPPGVADIKDMVRRVIVLSDTDSTCSTFAYWVREIIGKDDYTSRGVGISATVMTIVSLGMRNGINGFTINMNVAERNEGLLEMKNEFFWKTFSVGNATKHYYAYVFIKEGMVLREPELELKGSQYIASKTGLKFREHRDTMIRDVNEDIVNGRVINVQHYIKRTLELEQDIIDSVLHGDLSIMESTTIKGKRSYARPTSSPYQHYNFWKEVFADKYGSINEPPYVALKFNTTATTKGKIDVYLEGIEDNTIREKFKAYLKKYNKNSLKSLLLPHEILLSRGVPKELAPIVDTTRIIVNNLSPIYRVLSSIGIEVKFGQTLTSMGYELNNFKDY